MNSGTAYYDLAKNPPSFNFLDFLLESEKWRIRNGLEKIKISILPGPMDGFRKDCLPPTGKQERERWLSNIVIPMARLLPSSGEDARLNYQATEGITLGRDKYMIGFSSLMDSARQNLYSLKAPEEEVEKVKKKYGKYMTITIRDTGWWVDRTTKISEWIVVARELESQGYKVVFIPDGTKPFNLVFGFENDSQAAQNSFNRAVLYQGAEMNFGIPCGPLWMCWFLGAPTMIVKMLNDNEPSTSEATYKKVGLNRNTSLPNRKPRQRMVWKPEQADIILDEFADLMQ